EEAAALHYVAVESRGHAFLRCWCAKEAIAKALGTGLSTPPAEIAVGINAEGYASQRRYLHPASQQRFDLCHFDAGSEGCASIAVGELGDRFDITIGGIEDFLSWTFS